jgi:hypothetical protein
LSVVPSLLKLWLELPILGCLAADKAVFAKRTQNGDTCQMVIGVLLQDGGLSLSGITQRNDRVRLIVSRFINLARLATSEAEGLPAYRLPWV